MNIVRKLAFLVAFLVLFIPLMAANAATTFHATLSGNNQSPAIDTPAHGTATFTLSKSGKSLSFRLYVADIENVSMAHIHIGEAGKEGPVAVWLYPSRPPARVKKGKFTGNLASGVITAARLQGPMKGKTISDLVQEIKNGDAYVNVHTVAHPAGEIRGQIE
ncbi:MAG: CHRD domain-containing protein [Candidatus Acidiferrales bacterium]